MKSIMKKSLAHLIAAFILIFSGVAVAQNTQPKEIIVQSWKKGSETIPNQTIRISLGPGQREYTTEFMGSSGKIYRFIIIHQPLLNVKTEHWKMELHEVLQTREGKYELGGDLLVGKPPGPHGGHYFPREDLVGYWYPNEDPPVVWIGGNPFFEGYFFYLIKTTRKIRVEQFYLIAKAENYRFSNKDKSKLEFLDLIIEFQNACK